MRASARLVLTISLGLLLVAPATAAQETPLLTPEDAVRAHLVGVAAADASAILAASAVDEIAEGYRHDLFVERMAAFMPATFLAPSAHPFYVEVNRAAKADEILGQAQTLAYSLLSDVDTERMTVPADLGWAVEFARQVDPSGLAGLTVEEIGFPHGGCELSQRYLTVAATNAAVQGADEYTERVALVSLDGDLFTAGFSLLRYADDWLVATQVSPCGGTQPNGMAAPTTRDEYEALTLEAAS